MGMGGWGGIAGREGGIECGGLESESARRWAEEDFLLFNRRLSQGSFGVWLVAILFDRVVDENALIA